MSDYDRYACEWGYAYNVPAGDDTRILDLSERPLPAAAVDHDFWLVGHKLPVRMHYDDAGRFLGATVVDLVELGRYQAARDATWSAAEALMRGGDNTRSITERGVQMYPACRSDYTEVLW